MADRYHISRRTGRPMRCSATIRCPFGDMEADHYNSREEAQAAYETRNAASTLVSYKAGEVKISPLPDGIKRNRRQMVAPKGMYVLIDPSWVLQDNDPTAYRELRALMDKDNDDFAVGACYGEYPIMALKPGYEQGVYHDDQGRVYNMRDSRLALMPYLLTRELGVSQEQLLDDGVFVNFNKDTLVELNEGLMKFGPRLFIKTEPDGGEDEVVDDTWENESHGDPTVNSDHSSEEFQDASDADEGPDGIPEEDEG